MNAKPGVIVIFALPPGYIEAYWVANLGKANRVKMLKGALKRIEAEGN